MTMNSPESMLELYRLATTASSGKESQVDAAELMREVGLKCIGFNGVCLSLLLRLELWVVDGVLTGPPNNQRPRGILRRPSRERSIRIEEAGTTAVCP